MARRIANNPSGKYLQMTDAETAREQAKFERAVKRQQERDAAKAREGRQPYVTIFVHGHALDAARSVLLRLADAGDITADDRRAIADVLDPLSEVDRFGYLPNVQRSYVLPKR